MKEPYIAIVVLHYKNLEDTRECLKSLALVEYSNYSVIVVNNDESRHGQELADEFPDFTHIQNESNIGFAEGNNVGIHAALSDPRVDAVLLLNNDTVVEPDFLNEMAVLLSKYDMIAPRMMQYHDRGEVDNLGIVFMKSGLPFNRLSDKDKLFCPTGGCALYTRKLLETVGLFDPLYFAYCEDLDVGLRARLAGFESAYAPGAVIYHKGSAVHGKLSGFAIYHTYRNLIWTYYKNFPAGYFWGHFLYILVAWKLLFIYHLLKLRPLPLMRGFWDGIAGIKKFKSARAQIQKTCRVSSKEIGQWFEKGIAE